MSPKCVYGEHGMQGSFCPTAPESGMPCEPEPPTKLDPADFASLLEREPQEEGRPLGDFLATGTPALEAATKRIESLEGVLVAIRGKAAQAHKLTIGAGSGHIEDILGLISETLDPCKPWCVRNEPGHMGMCESEEREP